MEDNILEFPDWCDPEIVASIKDAISEYDIENKISEIESN